MAQVVDAGAHFEGFDVGTRHHAVAYALFGEVEGVLEQADALVVVFLFLFVALFASGGLFDQGGQVNLAEFGGLGCGGHAFAHQAQQQGREQGRKTR